MGLLQNSAAGAAKYGVYLNADGFNEIHFGEFTPGTTVAVPYELLEFHGAWFQSVEAYNTTNVWEPDVNESGDSVTFTMPDFDVWVQYGRN